MVINTVLGNLLTNHDNPQKKFDKEVIKTTFERTICQNPLRTEGEIYVSVRKNRKAIFGVLYKVLEDQCQTFLEFIFQTLNIF